MYQDTYSTPKRGRWIIVLIALIALGIVIAAASGIFYVVHSYSSSSDSGVAACKTMAENAKKPSSDNNKKMSEADYHKTRKPFEDSRYTDIKVAGTNLVDTIYKADQMGTDDADLGTAFALLSTIQTQWSALQVACGNAGVDLPGLTAS